MYLLVISWPVLQTTCSNQYVLVITIVPNLNLFLNSECFLLLDRYVLIYVLCGRHRFTPLKLSWGLCHKNVKILINISEGREWNFDKKNNKSTCPAFQNGLEVIFIWKQPKSL